MDRRRRIARAEHHRDRRGKQRGEDGVWHLGVEGPGRRRLLEVELRSDVGLLHEGKEPGLNREAAGDVGRRESPAGALIIDHRQDLLAEVTCAVGSPGRLARRLDGRKEEADERADDGDDNEQFDERERPRTARAKGENRHDLPDA